MRGLIVRWTGLQGERDGARVRAEPSYVGLVSLVAR